ncbi:EF-hand domain-containing protein [Antarctobacter heliothermus]|uniref:EF hand n=1 Tax=Antarctobacter heliothermus TaxID=74033 RepID=A0A239GMU8_9RHOB|nr:EF-hand domain-containing protein [Antarctobacter heliothermus]SNS70195.1 EF hand [Antarctobacter heliothermus]
MTRFIALALVLAAAPAFAQHGQSGAHFIEMWDLDGDAKVTAEEAAERRNDVFTAFDSDEDGFLDAEEYVMFDAAREADMAENGGHGRGAMMRAADGMLLAHNDTDNDGKVSREEFVGNAAAWIVAMDKNEDGAVTTADFGRGMGMGIGKN